MSAYRKFSARPFDECDVVLIGSGPANLGCAAFLAKYYAKKVLVLEAHDEWPGGCLHTFPVAGFKKDEFAACAGVHYLGRLGTFSRALWDNLTADENGVGQKYTEDMDSPTDHQYGVGELTPHNFEKQMGIPKSEFYRVSCFFNWIILVKVLWTPFAFLAWCLYVVLGHRAEAGLNYGDWCRAQAAKNGHPEMKENEMWWVQSGDHGMPRDQACALAGCVIPAHYMRGQTEYDGGMEETIRRICKQIHKTGHGAVLIDAKVTEITFDKATGAVTGVMVHGDHHIKAPVVVVPGAHAMQKLLGDKCPANIAATIPRCGLSPQHGYWFGAYKNKTAAQLGLPEGVQWIHNKYFLSHSKQPAGVLVYILWEMPYLPRNGDYEEAKDEYVDKAKEYVFKLWPALHKFDGEEAATPATTEKYINSYQGVSYGLGHVAARFTDWETVRALRPETDIPGVFMCHEDNTFCGVNGAFANAMMTAQMIVDPSIWTLFSDKALMRVIVDGYKEKVAKNDKKDPAKLEAKKDK